MSDPLRFEVGEEAAGLRLDTALASLAEVPRSQVQRWIDQGRVHVNDVAARASQRLGTGDEIVAEPPEPVATRLEPEAIPLVVLHEDSHLIVLDKRAGMVVHPGPGHSSGTLVNALLHHCGDLAGVGGVLRPGIVHRLDRGTSGVMVAAKDDRTHQGLSAQFHDHSIKREYCAFVRGVPRATGGRVDSPIGRHPRDRKRMSVRTGSGRAAITEWDVIARFPRSSVSRLAVHPQTGRTHQIRVHLASVGAPILGDPLYGRPRRKKTGPDLDRPALHAALLGFVHPETAKEMCFAADLPEDMATLERKLVSREGIP